MRIMECCPFYNENLITSIKISEDTKWIDELHITESDKTFTYCDKEYAYRQGDNKIVRYHKINGCDLFKKNRIGLTSKPLFIKKKTFAWHNEGVQRNMACSFVDVNQDDIVILSDIDEIIDHKYADRIIHETRKRGIITIKLYFTFYYFNLFSRNWGGAPDYSYRVFIMTGDYFNKMRMTSDELRKLGEQGKLLNDIYCIDGFSGFHHSWLGDDKFIAKKIKSYAHGQEDHDPMIFMPNGNVNMKYLHECLKRGKSIFGKEHQLHADNNIQLLESVNNIKTEYNHYFI